MKKYYISVFIPYLLFHLSGCYSMQRVTKDEFSPAPDYPDLYLKTSNKEYTFEEGNYIFNNDTIYGRGEMTILKNAFKPFEGKISINDVEGTQRNESDNNSQVPELLIKTKDKEFIFKNEEGSYSVRNDTIYGKGEYRLRYFDNEFEGAVSVDEAKYIEINKFNLGTTLVLVSVLVLSVVVIVAAISSFKIDFGDMWRGTGNVHP